jgi:hypothetical protein
MTSESDIVLELRTLARLIETKSGSVTFNEQDAAHLRQAADELEDMHATWGHLTVCHFMYAKECRARPVAFIRSPRRRILRRLGP